MALTKLSIAAARDGLAAGTFSAVELTRAHIDAVASARELNAFVTETPEIALDRAKESVAGPEQVDLAKESVIGLEQVRVALEIGLAEIVRIPVTQQEVCRMTGRILRETCVMTEEIT